MKRGHRLINSKIPPKNNPVIAKTGRISLPKSNPPNPLNTATIAKGVINRLWRLPKLKPVIIVIGGSEVSTINPNTLKTNAIIP